MNVGGQKNVTAAASPDDVQLLVGCGCNGTCGENTCTDPSQGCVCYGTTGAKQTSYAAIYPLSDNAQVATAKYNNGAITIYALAPGTAHVSVTAKLDKYSDSATQTISVTVSKSGADSKPDSSSSGGSTGGAGTSTGGPAGNSSAPVGGGTSVTAANVSPSAGGTVSKASGSSASGSSSTASSAASSSVSSAASSASGASSVESAVTSGSPDAATVELSSGPTGKTALMDIQGQDKSVVFEKKDGDKLLYFWTFNGKDVTAPADIDMSLTTSASSPIGKALGIKGEALYLNFAHSGSLPGRAAVSVNVGDTYRDGDIIYAYYYDSSAGKAKLIEKGVTVKDGFASFDITHCLTYFFTSSPLPAAATTTAAGRGASGSPVVPIVIVLTVLAALAFLYWLFWARKGGKPAELLARLAGRFNRT